MCFNSPDIETFKKQLETSVSSIKLHKTDSHAGIKIQSLLNIVTYVLTTRFLEGAVKHIVYNCAVIRGDSVDDIATLTNTLKKINNPNFAHIKVLFKDCLDFDVLSGKGIEYLNRDITFLNEIVKNRHKNVHASFDSTEWYNQNQKDITDFEKEFVGIEKILRFLDKVRYSAADSKFIT